MHYPPPTAKGPTPPKSIPSTSTQPVLTLADIGELQQMFEQDKYKQMRRLLFYFMNGHDEPSYYRNKNITPSAENSGELEENEYLDGGLGPYVNIMVSDYLAFLETTEDWHEELCKIQPRTNTVESTLKMIPDTFLAFITNKKKGWFLELCANKKDNPLPTKEAFIRSIMSSPSSISFSDDQFSYLYKWFFDLCKNKKDKPILSKEVFIGSIMSSPSSISFSDDQFSYLYKWFLELCANKKDNPLPTKEAFIRSITTAPPSSVYSDEQLSDLYNKFVASAKKEFINKASLLSDYGLAKGKVRGGLGRHILAQFKSDCLDFCDEYYALLDKFSELPDDQKKILPPDLQSKLPLSKPRKLALILCRFVHLLNTLSDQRATVSSFLTGSAKQKMGTPTHLDRSPLYHATPRSRDSLISFDLSDFNIETIKTFLQVFEGQFLEKPDLNYISRTRRIINNINPPRNDNSNRMGTPSFTSSFWTWEDDILTTINTIILILNDLEKDHTKIDQDSLDNLRDFRNKLQELKLHCLDIVSKFTPIFKKALWEYFQPEEIINKRYGMKPAPALPSPNTISASSGTPSNSAKHGPAAATSPKTSAPIGGIQNTSSNRLVIPLAVPKTPPQSPPQSPPTSPHSSTAHMSPPTSPFIRPPTSARKATGPSSLRWQPGESEVVAATVSAPDVRTASTDEAMHISASPSSSVTKQTGPLPLPRDIEGGQPPLVNASSAPDVRTIPNATQKGTASTASTTPLSPSSSSSSNFLTSGISSLLGGLGGFMGRSKQPEKQKEAEKASEKDDKKAPASTGQKKGSNISRPGQP